MAWLTIVRSVRNFFLVFLVVLALTTTLSPVPGFAEDSFARKAKSKVAPAYPEIARKMGLTGTVKIELVVAPNGTV